MRVKFKDPAAKCSWKVLGETETHYDLACLGWTPKELVEETDNADLIDGVDLYIELQKLKQ